MNRPRIRAIIAVHIQLRLVYLFAALALLLGCAGEAQADGRLLVSTGDVIAGKTLTGFGSFGSSITDSGDLVVRAFFSGGQGIFELDTGGGASLLVATAEQNGS